MLLVPDHIIGVVRDGIRIDVPPGSVFDFTQEEVESVEFFNKQNGKVNSSFRAPLEGDTATADLARTGKVNYHRVQTPGLIIPDGVALQLAPTAASSSQSAVDQAAARSAMGVPLAPDTVADKPTTGPTGPRGPGGTDLNSGGSSTSGTSGTGSTTSGSVTSGGAADDL